MVEAGGGERILTGVFDTGALAAFREKFPAWRDADEFVLK
jgi:omega-amidase